MRRVTLPRLMVVALLATMPSVPAMAAPAPTLGVEELRAGDKAEVRTVFAGSRIESFDAEILGVLRGGRAEGDMILARATSERVIRTGIAAGMSGSPVYVSGKLVGALSSGWTFEKEPIFGITPIREMLDVLDLPTLEGDGSSAGPAGVEGSVPGRRATFRGLEWAGAETEGPADTPPVSAAGDPRLAPLPMPVAAAGLNSAALDPARRLLAPLGFAVVPGGRSSGAGPAADSLVPGAAVAVDLMRGDLEMAAIGTVTYRDGDRVLIFGHPFFQAGPVRMPLSTAEIVTVVPNQASSFKLGVSGREVGVATQDRHSAVAGELRGRARLLPVSVTIRGIEATPKRFRFESLEDRALAPTLVTIATLNSVLESGGTSPGQTLRWRIRLASPGLPPLTLEDSGAGENPLADLAGGLGSPLRFLLENPYRRVRLDSIAIEVEARPGRDQWTLRGARVMAAAVRPGGRVDVRCELERWRGERENRALEVDVPEEVPPGRYTLWIGGGAELTRFEAQRAPAHFRPTSVEDAWRRLAHSRPDDALYAALIARAPEVTNEGDDYPELPGSAALLLTSGAALGDRRRSDVAWMTEVRSPLGGPVQGEMQIEITVDDHAP